MECITLNYSTFFLIGEKYLDLGHQFTQLGAGPFSVAYLTDGNIARFNNPKIRIFCSINIGHRKVLRVDIDIPIFIQAHDLRKGENIGNQERCQHVPE